MHILKKLIITLLVILIIASSVWYLKKVFLGDVRFDIVKHFSFSEENSLKEWKEKVFKGRVVYKIEGQERDSFVLATSKGTASALFYKIKMDMKKRPVISWKWNAKKFPTKGGQEDLN